MTDRRTPGRRSYPNGPFEAGALLGKYEIAKRLATGGMAEIYLARVSGLPGIQKMVVVKRILPQFADKTDFIEMFLDEARIVATLEHPNVVQLYDVGVSDGNYFIAMEYLHGEDVRTIVRKLSRTERKLPLEQALNIVIGVAAGLHYAHDKVGFDGKPLQIVHRDVNPQNVIVTYNGAVKLLDFGIAKASNRLNETRMGTLKGKVPYMSPEQCRGESLDRRSDLFSLGIMLYELTIGRQLYPGKSDFEVLKQIVEGTVVPPHELDPAYPPALEAIVMRALEKQKEKRYQTAREMQVDLEALVWQERLHVSPIALAQFMEELFNDKIDAWRAAQSRGETLGDHLQQTMPITEAGIDDDEEPVIEMTSEDAKRMAAERAAFRAHIEASSGISGVALTPRRAGKRWVLVGLLAAAGAFAWVEREAIWPSGKPAAGPQQQAVPATAATAAATTATGATAVAATATGATTTAAARPAETELAAPTVPSGMAERARPAAPDVKPQLEPQATIDPKLAPTRPAAQVGRAAQVGQAAHVAQVAPKRLPPPVPNNSRAAALKHPPGKSAPLASLLPRAPHPLPAPPPLPAESAPPPVQAAAVAASPPVVAAPAPSRPEPPARLDGEGTLMLASSPWCNVTVDGVAKGTTPLSMKLPAGKHTVVLTNAEFKVRRTLPITIAPDETVRKRLDFAQ